MVPSYDRQRTVVELQDEYVIFSFKCYAFSPFPYTQIMASSSNPPTGSGTGSDMGNTPQPNYNQEDIVCTPHITLVFAQLINRNPAWRYGLGPGSRRELVTP